MSFLVGMQSVAAMCDVSGELKKAGCSLRKREGVEKVECEADLWKSNYGAVPK